MILEDHSDIGMASGEFLMRRRRQRAALCFTASIVSLDVDHLMQDLMIII